MRTIRELAGMDWVLPELHRTSRRKLFENAEGWWILGQDRNAWDYFEAYKRSMAPVQIIKHCRERGVISLITPCIQTDGRFELFVNGDVHRFCCYRCAYKRVWDGMDVLLPQPEHFMIYMMLDSIGYIESPDAPREPARGLRRRGGPSEA
ncbi:MAG: hypothetical protein KIS92_00245 [Planctomycetota bacterium]|nr:hypothetical protein [Planctomycetota bacterium]